MKRELSYGGVTTAERDAGCDSDGDDVDNNKKCRLASVG